MKSFSIVGGLLATAVVFSLSNSHVNAQAASNPAPVAAPQNVVVQPGDSLSKIAVAHATTHVRLYDANLQIKDPDLIYAGDTVRIPQPDEQLASRTAAAPVATAKPVRKAKAAVTSANFDGGVWDRLAACESGGNWSTNTGNGYYGGLQFSASTWRAVGGSGLPHQASKAEQINRGKILQARSGWGQWPACAARLGLH